MRSFLAVPDLTPAEIRDAQACLGEVAEVELSAFADRQAAALGRVAQAERFYRQHDCRMARLHRLLGAFVVLCRFPGASPTFAGIGAMLHPVTQDGQPRGAHWAAYERACRVGRALEIRDEIWIAAHAADLREVRRANLDAAFEEEVARRPNHPTWRMIRRHFDFTLRARRLDDAALAEFRSSVEEAPEGPRLRLQGVLALRPRTALGRVLAHRVLRRPERLGCIDYVAVRREPVEEG